MAELNPPIPAGLLRRLAEAADGRRTGESIWFLAPVEDPTGDILGPFFSQGDADDHAPGGYGVFGPYRTPAEGPTPLKRVTRIQLLGEDNDGTEYQVAYSAEEVDAVFVGRPALDKFAVPYLARIYGQNFLQAWASVEATKDPDEWDVWRHGIWSPIGRCTLV